MLVVALLVGLVVVPVVVPVIVPVAGFVVQLIGFVSVLLVGPLVLVE